MPSGKISLMPAAIVPLTGTELFEIVQGGVNLKVTAAALAQTPIHASEAPGAGTITDFVLPGPGDYFQDIDTTAGDIEIDGTIAQRDGQRVTYTNTGPNKLKLGVGTGSVGNRIRANAGPLLALQNDSYTFQYCAAITQWIVT